MIISRRRLAQSLCKIVGVRGGVLWVWMQASERMPREQAGVSCRQAGRLLGNKMRTAEPRPASVESVPLVAAVDVAFEECRMFIAIVDARSSLQVMHTTGTE